MHQSELDCLRITIHATAFDVLNLYLNDVSNAGSGTNYTTTSREIAGDCHTSTADADSTARDSSSWSRCRRVARSLVGTPNYIAPEVLSQSGASDCVRYMLHFSLTPLNVSY